MVINVNPLVIPDIPLFHIHLRGIHEYSEHVDGLGWAKYDQLNMSSKVLTFGHFPVVSSDGYNNLQDGPVTRCNFTISQWINTSPVDDCLQLETSRNSGRNCWVEFW